MVAEYPKINRFSPVHSQSQGSYVGVELAGTQRPGGPHTHPLSYPLSLSTPGLLGSVWREIEKQRIREEITAERRLALEAEVRWEMMVEREMGLTRLTSGGAHMVHPPPPVPFGPSSRLAPAPDGVFGTSPLAKPLPDRVSDGAKEEIIPERRLALEAEVQWEMMVEREMGLTRLTSGVAHVIHLPPPVPFGSSSRLGPASDGVFGTSPLAKPLPDKVSNGAKEKPKIVLSVKPNETLHGSKRKAVIPLAGDVSKKRAKEEWSCSLCQVSTTCQQALNEHLTGKKHKSREAAKRYDEGGKSYSIVLLSKGKATEQISGLSESPPKENQNAEDNSNNSRYRFWCDLCQVWSNSVDNMNSHKNGKKHARRLEVKAIERKVAAKQKETIMLVNREGVEEDEKNVPSVDEGSVERKVAERKEIIMLANREGVEEDGKNVPSVDEGSVERKVAERQEIIMLANCEGLEEDGKNVPSVDEGSVERKVAEQQKEIITLGNREGDVGKLVYTRRSGRRWKNVLSVDEGWVCDPVAENEADVGLAKGDMADEAKDEGLNVS
ncbi:Unknown protein [Striga hermonthica]|uniref:Uncharacterized protein n=1 Tax=Striga hermonthica TaxID=68872 RepID=A0A9N7R6M3_STRHE|nr:Unknown protein [Striga hermonthica]